ncbi:MAG: hypothetical protein GC165_18005 [Armatimonadetes bacterium]|nr:hypothetical protein [Armatimonadota bacterium]
MPILIAWVAATMLRPQLSPDQLDAWLIKDSKGQSCASCHSPDGIELTGFSKADISRRIARHQTGTTAASVLAVLSGRLDSKSDGLERRPLQPGAVLLPGSNPQRRDEQFLIELSKRYPALFKPIKTLAAAQAMQAAILAIDLPSLPIGIQMDRLSEDQAHGLDHASIADWFPDVPVFDTDEIRDEARAYIANPSEDTLRALDQKVVSIAKTRDPFTTLALDKYRSLLVLQHEMRTGHQVRDFPTGNPFWQVAEFGRVYHESDYKTLGVPEDIAQAKRMDTTLHDQMKQIRLPWYWLGWTRDPSLTKSGPMRETIRADYFCKYLEEDGPYMGHELFMLTRKLAEQNRSPIVVGEPWEIQYSFFLANTPLIQREPKIAQAQSLFRDLAVNSFKMSLLLLEKDLQTRKRTIRPVPQASQIKFLSQYLKDIGKPEDVLVNRVLVALKATPTH